jgi:hypothetical protein
MSNELLAFESVQMQQLSLDVLFIDYTSDRGTSARVEFAKSQRGKFRLWMIAAFLDGSATTDTVSTVSVTSTAG